MNQDRQQRHTGGDNTYEELLANLKLAMRALNNTDADSYEHEKQLRDDVSEARRAVAEYQEKQAR